MKLNLMLLAVLVGRPQPATTAVCTSVRARSPYPPTTRNASSSNACPDSMRHRTRRTVQPTRGGITPAPAPDTSPPITP